MPRSTRGKSLSSLVGKTLARRYEILKLLGKGGMGEVYEAEQKDLKRRVAIKVLASSDETDLLRFKQEALAAAGLAHPNIVQIYDFIDEPGAQPFLVMELLRGVSLSALVKKSKLEPARAVSIMTQVLSALAAAHDARIVHRDVKPENIFVCESNHSHHGRIAPGSHYDLVKVLDFGLARPLDDDKHIARTRVGVAMGTPAYMAPEQARGATADVRMDVFAAGVTLYYALAGRRPFEGKTASELMRAVKVQPPIPLDAIAPSLDLDLVRVVERSLSKEPSARFSSARSFLEALTPLWPRERAPNKKSRTNPNGPNANSTKASRTTAPGKKRSALAIQPFEEITAPIGASMIHLASFARDGRSALAVGPAGLARWTMEHGWSARELPPSVWPADVRAIAFGAADEALIASSRGVFVRAQGAYTAFGVPENFVVHGAHVDHASHVVFAGTLGGDGVVVDCAPSGATIHTIGRGIVLHAVTRASNNSIVACGDRGTVCIVAGSQVHAHAAGRSSLRAIAPYGNGFVCVGERGALVTVSEPTPTALAAATELTFATEDLSTVRTRAKFVCALGTRVHLASLDTLGRAASSDPSELAASIRDIYLDNGVVRAVVASAAVLDAAVMSAVL